MSKNTTWEKVSFNKKKAAPVCELTFRSTGHMVVSVNTLEALDYPQYVYLLQSNNNHLIALQAASKSDGDAIQLTSATLPKDKPRAISAPKIYQWVLELLKQNDNMLIRLVGTPNEDGMVVFDLKKAEIKPKRELKRKPATEE